jgi:tRNA A-37 threonylcarbamoyl transferase component Bud32
MQDDQTIIKNWQWKDLQKISYDCQETFSINLLDDENDIIIEKILRIIPKRRIIAFGKWQGKEIVAKLFIDENNAKKHQEKDLNGIRLLNDNNIPTAKLFYHGASADGRTSILIFEYIKDAITLGKIWDERSNDEATLELLQTVMIEIATQHVLGVVQTDIHLNNFLLANGKIYTLDGAQIKPYPLPLAEKISLGNLSLFFAQLGVGEQNLQLQLLHYYASARGWILTDKAIGYVFNKINAYNNQRWQHLQKKMFRTSSDFVALSSWSRRCVYIRQYHSAELLTLLANPEQFFKKNAGEILKDGNSSTVMRISIGNRDMVIKRYNIKGFFHWLRRMLKPSRAANAWGYANQLALFGITTAKPIAFIEYRILGLRTRSYFIMEAITGYDAKLVIDNGSLNQGQFIKHITQLFNKFKMLKLIHGDLKISNILLNQNNTPVIIDLDGIKQYHSMTLLHRAWQKEKKRFLTNFQHNQALYQQFVKEWQG